MSSSGKKLSTFVKTKLFYWLRTKKLCWEASVVSFDFFSLFFSAAVNICLDFLSSSKNTQKFKCSRHIARARHLSGSLFLILTTLRQMEFGFVQNQKLMQVKWADSIWERRELSNWRNVEIRPLSSLFPSCLFTLGVSAQLTLLYATMLCSYFLEQKKGWKILIKQNPDSNSSWEFQFSKAKNSAAGCRMPLSW